MYKSFTSWLRLFLSIYSFGCCCRCDHFLIFLSHNLLLLYKINPEFYLLILYSETLLNLLIGYNSFFVCVCGVFRFFYSKSYVIYKQKLSSLLLDLDASSFSYLIALARVSSMIFLNRSVKNWHRCLIPDHRGKVFHFSTLIMMFTRVFSHTALIMLSYIPSVSNFLRVCITKGWWILSNVLSVFVEMILTLMFNSANVVYHINWFVHVETPFHSRDKVHRILANDPFNVPLHLVC